MRQTLQRRSVDTQSTTTTGGGGYKDICILIWVQVQNQEGYPYSTSFHGVFPYPPDGPTSTSQPPAKDVYDKKYPFMKCSLIPLMEVPTTIPLIYLLSATHQVSLKNPYPLIQVDETKEGGALPPFFRTELIWVRILGCLIFTFFARRGFWLA